MIRFDRKTYFDLVRQKPFGGSMVEEQVQGQEFILTSWEQEPASEDLRHLAYMLATALHETARMMCPVEEIGWGSGHSYGATDAQTGQKYFGRGWVQCTWRDNYKRATQKLALSGFSDLEWHAFRALDPTIAYKIMVRGMEEGWFTGKKLSDYFDVDSNNPNGARQIINPDDKGPLIAGYHQDFLAALTAAADAAETVELAPPSVEREPKSEHVVAVEIVTPPGVRADVTITRRE